MGKDEIIAKLRDHRQRLSSMGVARLSIFGSTARGDDDENSDIDLAVCLEDRFSAGGFDYFSKLALLRDDLSQVLGRPVDLVEEPVRSERIQAAIEKDRVVAFQ